MSPRARSNYLDRPSSRRRSSYSSYGSSGGGGLRRIGYLLLLLVVLAIAGAVAQWFRPLPAQHVQRGFAATVTASGDKQRLPWPKQGQAAVAIEGLGTVGSSGGTTPLPIASVAKIMTAYQILTDHPLRTGLTGRSLTATPADVADYHRRVAGNQSVLAVRAGERLTEYKALQALLIPSANNVAVMLARWDGRTVAGFVHKMNATAHKLGLTHTHYSDPDGTSPTTVSTAIDQVVLAQKAMRLPVFAEIVAQSSATFPIAGTLFNYNYNIGHDGFIGIKTGSNSAAGGCWAFAATRTVAGRNGIVYGVVLGQRARNGELIQPALDLGRRLADAAPKMVRTTTVLASGARVGTLAAKWREDVPIVTQKALTVVATPGRQYDVRLRLDPPKDRSLAAGAVVGSLTVGAATTPVVVAHAAPGPTIGWRLTRIT